MKPLSPSAILNENNLSLLSTVLQMHLRTLLWSFYHHSQPVGQTHHSTNLLLHPILALTTHQEWGEYIIPCLIFSSVSKIDFCFLKLSCNLNQKKVKKTIHFCKGLKSNGCTCINTILSCLSPKNKCFILFIF